MDINLQKRNGEMISIGSGIAESGDGYIRFNDGTQICYGTISNAYHLTTITYPKPFFVNMPCVTFNHSNIYASDINAIYSFHVTTDYRDYPDIPDIPGQDTTDPYVWALILRIEFISIKTVLATADLGGHRHTIKAEMKFYEKGIKSNSTNPEVTLDGIDVSYIAIGRWK